MNGQNVQISICSESAEANVVLHHLEVMREGVAPAGLGLAR